jgi:hypothetical protein
VRKSNPLAGASAEPATLAQSPVITSLGPTQWRPGRPISKPEAVAAPTSRRPPRQHPGSLTGC